MSKDIITAITIIISLIIILIIIPLTYFYDSYICTKKENNVLIAVMEHPIAKIECPKVLKMNSKEIIGPNLGTMPIQNITEEQCQKICQDRDCNWYNYNQRKNLCWLKKGNLKNDYLTAIRIPDMTRIKSCPSYHIYNNMDIDGSTTKSYQKITQSQCQNLCDQQECDWYSYDKKTNECSLKKGKEINQINVGFNIIPDHM